MTFSYRCSECGEKYDISPVLMVCPRCSSEQRPDEPLRGILEVELEGTLGEDFTIFDMLPVEKEFFPPLPVGDTPLWEPSRLREKYGFPGLYIKDDSANPTGSFKDRASYLVAAFAKKYGISDIVLASTGNAGSSMSGVGAAAGLKVTLFLPHAAPAAKMVQALQYGANLIRVKGTYDDAYELSMDYSLKNGGLSRNTAYNPMTIEGKKTAAVEIFKQLGNRAPEYVFIPTGDGVIAGGIYKGFKDLKKLGFITNIPQIFCVQSEGSSAVSRALKNGRFTPPVPSATIADSISVDIPRNGYYILKQLKEYGGESVTVTDERIIEAQKELSSMAGLFAEPASSASFAGFLKVRETLPKGADIVLLVTGSGLKDIDTAVKGISIPE